MYNDWFYLEQSRVMRERELTKRMAERRQYAQLKEDPRGRRRGPD